MKQNQKMVRILACLGLALCLVGSPAASPAQEPKLRLTFGGGHTDRVFDVILSPDGKVLASMTFDGTVKLWDVASGKNAATLNLPSGPIKEPKEAVLGPFGLPLGCPTLAFSPDGKVLATKTFHGTVKLWDVASGKDMATFERDKSDTPVAPGPDGKTLAMVARDGSITLQDVASGKETAILKGGAPSFPISLAFSSDGLTLASGGRGFDEGTTFGEVKLWEVKTGQQRAHLKGHANHVLSVAFSPDGKALASLSGDRAVKLWDVASGKETQTVTLKGLRSDPQSVAFSRDGKAMLACCSEKTIGLWDVAGGKEAATLNPHFTPSHSVAFSPDVHVYRRWKLRFLPAWGLRFARVRGGNRE
jgi:WD40 repeat protein